MQNNLSAAFLFSPRRSLYEFRSHEDLPLVKKKIIKRQEMKVTEYATDMARQMHPRGERKQRVESLAPAMRVVISLSVMVMALCFVLRAYSRLVVKRNWGGDDCKWLLNISRAGRVTRIYPVPVWSWPDESVFRRARC